MCEIMTSRLNIVEFNRPKSILLTLNIRIIHSEWYERKPETYFKTTVVKTYKKKDWSGLLGKLFNDCASNGLKSYFSFALPCFAEI